MAVSKEKWAVKVNPKGYGFDVVEGKHRIADQLTEANAHLIAAAPEMYEALKLYHDHQKGTKGHYCWKCAEVIESALAKAEGKEG